jgi:uncharacterized membrane protein required for colicin V production
MTQFGWPDLLIGLICCFAAVAGFRRGFVGELSGTVAILFALITPWFYQGNMDAAIQVVTRLGPGSAHVIGMFIVGVATYVIVRVIARLVDRVAHLPVLSIFNRVGGAGIGLIKGLLFCWVLLYIALFFPLSPDLRSDLHRSPFVIGLSQNYGPVDTTLKNVMPWFARPFVNPYFWRHRA